MRKHFLLGAAALSGAGFLLGHADRVVADPVVGGLIFVNSTQDIIATYVGNSASYEDDLYLYSPTNSLGRIFGNHIDAVGTQKDLGSFPVGTELTFDIHVTNTGDIFYSGAASQNADNHAHARVTYNYTPTTSLVEFEDLLGGPYDYNDLSFTFTNVGSVHPIISLTAAAPASVYGNQLSNGSGADMGHFSNGLGVLTVTGKQGGYLPSQVTGIDGGLGAASDYVTAQGFNPATDPEIYGLDVLIGGVQATPAQISTLVADINSASAFGYGASIASATDPTRGDFNQLSPLTNYNLFLTFTGLNAASNDLGFDLTQDPTFGSSATVAAIAVVPEPASICLVGFAAVAVLRRRIAKTR